MITFTDIKVGDKIGALLKHRTFIGNQCFDANTRIFCIVIGIPENSHQVPCLKVIFDNKTTWENLYDYYIVNYELIHV